MNDNARRISFSPVQPEPLLFSKWCPAPGSNKRPHCKECRTTLDLGIGSGVLHSDKVGIMMHKFPRTRYLKQKAVSLIPIENKIRPHLSDSLLQTIEKLIRKCLSTKNDAIVNYVRTNYVRTNFVWPADGLFPC
jgi:hypothetical protein